MRPTRSWSRVATMGVELPAEQVPRLQKQTIRTCRAAGKPVVVATQMLESMITSPVPTRAEASDVANAVYDGADAVMLSADFASGHCPGEVVAIMDRIIAEMESDPDHRSAIDASDIAPQAAVADAICLALQQTTNLMPVAANSVPFDSPVVAGGTMGLPCSA